MRRTPLRSRPRTAAPAPDRDLRLAERAQRVMADATPRTAAMAHVAAPAAPVHKERPIRSEAYRRAVASLPCVICGVPGHSQAAHANTGKGAGIKTSDLTCFPACADRPGVRGCHSRLDQGALYPKHIRQQLEPAWAADTQRRLVAMGLWPKNLPQPQEL